jgi:flagellar biosynthesis protein FlhG
VNNSYNVIYEHLFLKKGRNRNISLFISAAEQAGTTWCSLSIAHALNQEKFKTLFVDAHGNFSNANSYLQLNNDLYIEDYAKGLKTINQILTAYKNKNFNLLIAKPGGKFLHAMQMGRISIFAEDLVFLADDYDHTIIDSNADNISKTLNLCQIADNIILVCSENNADITKTFELIRKLNESNINANYYLIINKVNSFEDGFKVYEKLCKASDRTGLKYPDLLGIIRFDTRVRDTIKNKELLLTRYPTSEAASDIKNITKKLCLEK